MADTPDREAAINALTSRISDLADLLEKSIKQDAGSHKQTIIHRTEGMGMIGLICASVAFCCLLGVGGVAWMVGIELSKQTADLHDLRAWRDIHAQRISALEAQRKEK